MLSIILRVIIECSKEYHENILEIISFVGLVNLLYLKLQ